MIKEAWYILEAKKIIGKWGYEEKAWWNPIAKALKKTDIEAYARGLHDGQIFGRKNEKLENNSHKHPCGNTPHCFCGKCSPTYNDTPQEWESLYPLNTFSEETQKEIKEFFQKKLVGNIKLTELKKRGLSRSSLKFVGEKYFGK